MNRGFGWFALLLGVGLAAAGALVTYGLAGGPWAGVGAVVGAVTGAFAPSVHDGIRKRRAARKSWQDTVERRPHRSWARLLDPRFGVVSFVGRQRELAALLAWCQDGGTGRLRLVTGPGGVGKTRLAIELAQRLSESGWSCERVADGREVEAISALRTFSRQRALLIVDYAEARVGLERMLSALADDQHADVKVLLLARSAGEWWTRLGITEPAVWDLVQSATSGQLTLVPEIAAGMPDSDVIAQAVSCFARELGVAERIVEIYDSIGRGRRCVLDLHTAALVALLADGSPRAVQVDVAGILDELLRHEKHFWYASAWAAGLTEGPNGLSALMLCQVVTASCLLGAVNEGAARALPGRVPGLSASARIGHWLRELYPPGPEDPDWLGSLQPDRLAELHALRELVASPELARACLTNLDARQAQRALTLLARASADYSEAEELLSQVLPDVANLIVHLDVPLEALVAIYNAIPNPTVVLAAAAAAIAQQIVNLLPARPKAAIRAHWLSILTGRLCDVGRPADALPVAEEAVAINRELAASLDYLAERLPVAEYIASNPDDPNRELMMYRHRPDLARSLGNLGIVLAALGRWTQAQVTLEEVVAIFRELAAADPNRYRPELAQSLSNLTAMLSNLGRPDDALPFCEEAVALQRELALAGSDSDERGLAGALSNLGIQLSELRRPADALVACEEATAIRRKLSTDDPDRYRPDFAKSLTSLGLYLSELGRPADALTACEEAVAIFREVATANPDRYRPDLAASLYNLSVTLFNLSHPADALLPTAQETVSVYRELVVVNPPRYGPQFAKSLDNLGTWLTKLGHSADALQATAEAAATYRELSAADPDRYRVDLAKSLQDLGLMFLNLGRSVDALPVFVETAAIYRELAVTSHDHNSSLALSLYNLGATLFNLGRHTDALPIAEEAVAIYQNLQETSPNLPSDLGQFLDRLLALLTSIDHRTDASTD